MAKFSRSSTAYKQDGSVVNAGVPRFESNGVMVEEGTVNLVNLDGAVNGNFIKNADGSFTMTKYSASARYSNTIYLTKPAGTNLTFSLISLAKNPTVYPDQIISIQGYYSDNTIFYLIFTLANPTITKILDKELSRFRLYLQAGEPDGTFSMFKNFMCEAKPYATSFHPTTRSPESLTIPATALNATEGTIEFDVVFNLDSYIGLGYRYILDVGSADANSRIILYTHPTGGVVNLQVVLGTMYEGVATLFVPIKGVKYRFAITYKDKASIWINGVKKGTSINNLALNITRDSYIGSHFSNFINTQPNALFSNLRISSIARTDAELANTGALAVDEFTTYSLPMNGNLSATCRPVMLVQGSGQVLLSRVGRGTRAIKVQGEGQVKLKRSACYYPTIAVGTKGEVQLSRQGIGYRKMKVEGQGSFKIQEPNIEIYPEIREREATTNIIERESITEVIGVPYAGDTIKIKGTFKSFEGVLADPTSITLKIYDTINNLLTTINVTATNKISAGVYEVNYTIPDGYQTLYYEWHCVQGDSPQVTMGKITVLKRGHA